MEENISMVDDQITHVLAIHVRIHHAWACRIYIHACMCMYIPVEPRLHLPHTHTGLVKVHILPILAVHAQSLLGWLATLILLELQLCHAIKQLC